jgi:prevent-host-death family protein
MTLELSDIHSLSDFQRNTKDHLREMERTGNPRVLTVNGKARVVVQDARSYQRLLRRVEEADTILTLRSRLASLRRGKKGRDLFEVLEELGEGERVPRPRRR